MDIVPRFSFNYRNKPFDLADAKVTPADYGRLYEPGDGLRIELHIEEWPAYNAISWTLWFENTGDRDSGLISDIRDCDAAWCFAGGSGEGAGTTGRTGQVAVFDTSGNASYESYLLAEKTVSEFSVHRKVLPLGAAADYHPNGGRSASGQMPFFDVYARGRGLIVAVGWSGQWHASFSHLDGEIVQIRTGLEYTSFKLHPGERIRTSSVLLMEYEGTRVRGGNIFRRLIKNELCPYTPDRYPFALEGMGMTTEKHLFHLEKFRQHGIKADYYWIDAGWYGKGGAPGASDWYKQVGNWQVRPDEHPDGLKDVVRAVNDSGMRLLLWMEPERAYPGTDLVVDHPDWLYPLDGFYLLLRLEKDEVREYLFDLICGFIDRLGIGCFRQDFNMEPLQSWRITDEMYRGGINEIKYIMNLYKLWDDLRARYPELVIDNCASGGRRIDIESLRRAIPVWRTDAYCEPDCDPDVIQTQSFGFERLIPCSGGVCKKAGDTYATRSAYAPAYVGSWWWTDRPTPTEEQFEWMAKMCDEYRALRQYFSCDFYPLENCGWSYAHGGWAAYRYDRPEQGDGIVIAFRREGSNCETSRYPLEGLDNGSIYTVNDVDSGGSFELSGSELADNGLVVTIPEPRMSRILLYRKKA
jgi:alpha-galactosidase